MRHFGLLPLKASSTSVTAKNRKKMLGRPLFCWVLTQAVYSKLDTVIVATNDDWIITFIDTHFSWTDKITTVSRSKASENGNFDAVALEFLENTTQDFDTLTLLLATNPFTTAKDINHCLEALVNGNDAVFTGTTPSGNIWDDNGDLQGHPDTLVQENAAVYSTMVSQLKNSKLFINGKTATITMDDMSAVQLKNHNQWEQVELQLANNLISQKQNAPIKYLVLDVDGVFTDGGVYYDENGELAKRFDMRDGMGLEILREHNVQVVIMTSEDSALVRKRMQKLKVEHLFLGAKDKYSLLEEFILAENCTRADIAYVGDDVNDLANLCSVGWSFAPKNATTNVLPHVDVILSKDSGNGAIREATEFILQYNKRQF